MPAAQAAKRCQKVRMKIMFMEKKNDVEVNDISMQDFTKAISECKGDVYMVTAEGDRLNLRAGPGPEYDILGKISSSTLRVYGYSSAAPGWALVRYDPLYDVPQFGWVSTAYLISAE